MTTINGYSSSFGMSSLYGATTPKSTKTGMSATPAPSDSVAQFLAYQKMTPEQKLRDSILKKLGLTEDMLSAMPAQMRKEAEAKIQEDMTAMIKNKMAERGILVDITA